MAGNARLAAVQALLQVHRDQGYSNVVLDNLLKSGDLGPADRALASRLFYGVIERRLTLDYVLAACSTVPIKKMHPCVTEILRCGIYQLLYMDKIPPSAAVSEAVNLTKALRQPRASGFVNGVLRGVERKKGGLLDGLPDTDEGLEIRYSCPRGLLRLWREAYGDETARALAAHINDVPDACLRVNTLKISADGFAARLEAAGLPFEREPVLPASFRVDGAPQLKRLAPEAENWYYHQDTASQWCCYALGARPGERIADVCAAPGGKSFTLAQYMDNQGEILACDLYPAKCDTMEKRAAALGITCLRTAARDASKPCPAPLRGRFDRVQGFECLRGSAGAAIPDSRRGGGAYPARRGAAILHLHPQPGGKRAGSRTVPAGKSGVLPADAAAGGLFRGGGQADGAYLDAVPAYASYGRVLPGGLCSVGRPFFIKNGWCA